MFGFWLSAQNRWISCPVWYSNHFVTQQYLHTYSTSITPNEQYRLAFSLEMIYQNRNFTKIPPNPPFHSLRMRPHWMAALAAAGFALGLFARARQALGEGYVFVCPEPRMAPTNSEKEALRRPTSLVPWVVIESAPNPRLKHTVKRVLCQILPSNATRQPSPTRSSCLRLDPRQRTRRRSSACPTQAHPCGRQQRKLSQRG